MRPVPSGLGSQSGWQQEIHQEGGGTRSPESPVWVKGSDSCQFTRCSVGAHGETVPVVPETRDLHADFGSKDSKQQPGAPKRAGREGLCCGRPAAPRREKSESLLAALLYCRGPQELAILWSVCLSLSLSLSPMYIYICISLSLSLSLLCLSVSLSLSLSCQCSACAMQVPNICIYIYRCITLQLEAHPPYEFLSEVRS